MATVLVTGSSGHLGEALMRTLPAAGWEAVGLDVKPSAFTRHVGSITDRRLVERCLQGVQAVVHTATLHKPHVDTHRRQEFVETNVTGTLVLLEAAVAAGVRAFDRATREAYEDANLKVNELLYRRADLEDVVDAHRRALVQAGALGFGRYIVSATTPFLPEDLPTFAGPRRRRSARRPAAWWS